MRYIFILLFLGLIGGAGWWGYSHLYPVLLNAWSEVSPPEFPVERVLTDRTSRTVAVRLLARSETEVRFVRLSDGMTFQYPIASLSDDDQAFIRRFRKGQLGSLPDQGWMSSQLKREDHLRRERSELEHQVLLLELELEKENTKSPTLSRNQIQQRIDDSKNRIIDIDKELKEIAFRASR